MATLQKETKAQLILMIGELRTQLDQAQAEINRLRTINVELSSDHDALVAKLEEVTQKIEQVVANRQAQPRPTQQQQRRERDTVEYSADIEARLITIGDQVFQSDKEWKKVRTGMMVGGIIIPLDGKGRLPKSNLDHILSRAGFKPVATDEVSTEAAPEPPDWLPIDESSDPFLRDFLPS